MTSYLVFWQLYSENADHVSVVSIDHAPHDQPKGATLHEMVAAEVSDQNVAITGVVELPSTVWSAQREYDLLVGGRAAILECDVGGWSVHEAG